MKGYLVKKHACQLTGSKVLLAVVCFAFGATLVTASSPASHSLASLGLASWASVLFASGLHTQVQNVPHGVLEMCDVDRNSPLYKAG